MQPRLFAPLAALLASACANFDDAPGPDGDAGAADLATPPGDAAGARDSALATDSAAPTDGPAAAFSCAQTKNPPAPNPCPAPVAKSGQVSFCFRAGWSGVTAVEVYGGFHNDASDWKMPFASLTDDGTGTFTATVALADGSYPYLYRTHGAADGLVKDGQYLLDQENPQFEPNPPMAPLQRSVSVVTVPQVAPTLRHLRGALTFAGQPLPCYSVALDAGELRQNGKVLSEHTTANFAESAADGTFDFPVADGPMLIAVRFPFGLVTGYPDPAQTGSSGIARTGVTVAGADVTLDPVDLAYPDYALMAPASGGAQALPVTFQYSVIPGAQTAAASVIATNIAGNDPAWEGPFDNTGSATFDGTLGGNGGMVVAGKQYYWGSWQRFPPRSDGGVSWVAESLLYPITFQ
jgi:hypothetical protein